MINSRIKLPYLSQKITTVAGIYNPCGCGQIIFRAIKDPEAYQMIMKQFHFWERWAIFWQQIKTRVNRRTHVVSKTNQLSQPSVYQLNVCLHAPVLFTNASIIMYKPFSNDILGIIESFRGSTIKLTKLIIHYSSFAVCVCVMDW